MVTTESEVKTETKLLSARQMAQFVIDGWDGDEIRRFFRMNKNAHNLTGEAEAVGWARASWWRYLCGADELIDPSGTGAHGDYA